MLHYSLCDVVWVELEKDAGCFCGSTRTASCMSRLSVRVRFWCTPIHRYAVGNEITRVDAFVFMDFFRIFLCPQKVHIAYGNAAASWYQFSRKYLRFAVF